MSSIASSDSSPPTVAATKPLSQSARAEKSVYVGDLPSDVTKEQLTKVFSQASPVLAVRIHVAKKPGQHPKAFAYVAYSSSEEVDAAIREFHQYEFSGKPCRVMKTQPGSTTGPADANVFVKHLPLKLSAVAFHDTFAAFGEVLSSKLAVDGENTSKGYGFVQYATAEQAQKAIAGTHGSTLDVEDGGDKPLQTSLFVKKDTRPAPPARESTNVFFKNLPARTTLESFTRTWSKYGPITSAVLNRDADGKPNGTAFANFEKASAAAKVVKATLNKAPDGVHAVRALSKAERERHQTRKAVKAPASSA